MFCKQVRAMMTSWTCSTIFSVKTQPKNSMTTSKGSLLLMLLPTLLPHFNCNILALLVTPAKHIIRENIMLFMVFY